MYDLEQRIFVNENFIKSMLIIFSNKTSFVFKDSKFLDAHQTWFNLEDQLEYINNVS